ncbi:hypothetical protein SD436_01575 [Streptococcus sp. 2A/TPW/M5]
MKLDFGDFYFSRAIKKINRLTEVETTYFDQRNEYREIELALKASRKERLPGGHGPHGQENQSIA